MQLQKFCTVRLLEFQCICHLHFLICVAGQKRSHHDDAYYSAKALRQSSQSPPRYHQAFGPSGDLIVLGLRYDVDEQEMRDYFQHFGEIEQVEVRKIDGLKSFSLV